MWPLPGWAIRAIVVAVVLAGTAAAGARWGYKLADGRWQAREAERLAAEAVARAEDLARAQAVSTAYQALAAELKRLAAVHRVEVLREIDKPVYRDCVLPESGRVLIDAAQSRAASAAAGPGGALPAPSRP
jgi:hypothetical protein